MLEIMQFVAELAERVGRAEAKLEEAEALIDEMEDALCEDEVCGDGDEDGDESPIVVLIVLDGSVYVRSE